VADLAFDLGDDHVGPMRVVDVIWKPKELAKGIRLTGLVKGQELALLGRIGQSSFMAAHADLEPRQTGVSARREIEVAFLTFDADVLDVERVVEGHRLARAFGGTKQVPPRQKAENRQDEGHAADPEPASRRQGLLTRHVLSPRA